MTRRNVFSLREARALDGMLHRKVVVGARGCSPQGAYRIFEITCGNLLRTLRDTTVDYKCIGKNTARMSEQALIFSYGLGENS